MLPDTFGIEADGTYIMQGINCRVDIRGKAHVFDGEIFTRLILPGKGPIGFILKPDRQGSLTFTSTRTQRNATYSKLPENPCPSGAIGRPGVAPKEEGHLRVALGAFRPFVAGWLDDQRGGYRRLGRVVPFTAQRLRKRSGRGLAEGCRFT